MSKSHRNCWHTFTRNCIAVKRITISSLTFTSSVAWHRIITSPSSNFLTSPTACRTLRNACPGSPSTVHFKSSIVIWKYLRYDYGYNNLAPILLKLNSKYLVFFRNFRRKTQVGSCILPCHHDWYNCHHLSIAIQKSYILNTIKIHRVYHKLLCTEVTYRWL